MNTKQKIEVMQAYLDGKAVKVTKDSISHVYIFKEDGELAWTFGDRQYEIFKEPAPGYRLYAAYAEAADLTPVQEENFATTYSANNWAEVERRIKSGELKFD